MKWLVFIAFVLAAPAAPAGPSDKAAAVLRKNCHGCHGQALQMSKLDLSSRETMIAGGERGSALTPGQADQSRMFRVVAGMEKPTMPPGKTLSSGDVETIRQWINSGAEWTNSEPVEKPDATLARLEERSITPEERRYWAFVPPVRHAVPDNGETNPVDAFLELARTGKKLSASPSASRRTLIRRAYLDLTGLLPAPEEVEAFVNDPGSDAFARLVERLLASPQYGERWARHWLDVVRYADSGGYEYDRDRPNAWRYRDYVIRSFNADKSYAQFVREQLAGDEIASASGSADARIATGFLRMGLENNIKSEQTRMDELDDLVSTTGAAFLGVTLGCARCHNHKFDPIPQKDYYRIQAVFFPTKAFEYTLAPKTAQDKFKVEQDRVAESIKGVKDRLQALENPYRERLLAQKKAKLPEYIQAALRTPPEQRSEGQRLNAAQVEKTLAVDEKELLAALPADALAQHKQISSEIAALEAQRPTPLPTAMSVAEPGRDAPPSYFLHRGSPSQKGTRMEPGVLTVASNGEWTFPPAPANAQSSFRRKAFGEWLTSPANPLTARVMVNRIWQQHFGEGLVRSTNNFGKTGERPSHPELLDWLATEFVQSGWSIKAMHRLMMNSKAYQQASDDMPANAAIDGDNRYLWRQSRRRLEAEVVRDSLLVVAGNLERQVGGPAVHPYIDPALFQSSSKRTWEGKPDSDPETWRRSVYVFSKRSIPLPILEVFDKPDSVGSCARRNRSTIAPQSLILMNNAFVLQQAGRFAARVRGEAGEDTASQVDRAFQIALSRHPTQSESERSIAFIRGSGTGLQDFCQTLMNLNEFVYQQ